jgi:shikimate dehydrogenase
MQNNNLTNKTLHKFYNNRDYSLFGVIGNPVSHSKSPDLHKDFLFNAGLERKADYIKINITNPAELKDIILTMPKMGFIGCNITTPFKEQVFDIIAKLANKGLAKHDLTTKIIGAVNCLFFNPDTGIIEACNTDASGFITDLKDKKFTFTTNRVLMIGAGGASRAIIAGLLNLDIRCLHISIINRTYEKAKNIENHFKSKYQFYRPSIKAMQAEELEIQSYDLIINTTSLGLKANEYPDIDYNKINHTTFCYDVIYPSDSPHSLTPFLQKCLDAGVGRNKLCNGYGMLFNQALASFKIWTEAAMD